MSLNRAIGCCYKTANFIHGRTSRSCRPLNNFSYSQKLHAQQLMLNQIGRCYCSDEKENKKSIHPSSRVGNYGKRSSTLGGVVGKYKIFQDADAPMILDVDEERQLRLENPELFTEVQPQLDPFVGMNLGRGESGVFDIEELVEVLRSENAQKLMTIAIPPEVQYVDYMVIVSARSQKHAYALAEFVRKLFKRKMREDDGIPIIEGGKANDWLAIDLGNIALHIFTERERQRYDIETLWSVGIEFDSIANEKDDEYIQLLKEHTHPSLSGIQPIQSPIAEENQSR